MNPDRMSLLMPRLNSKNWKCHYFKRRSESINSNVVLHTIFYDILKKYNVPQILCNLPKRPTGISLKNYFYLIIYRHSYPSRWQIFNRKNLKRLEDTVIKHLDGICHVYIDEFADKKRAVDITMNSKTQRLGTCNTLETLW